MKKIKILSALLALASFSANAQQDPQYTHYMYNTININPAYAGSRGSLSIFGLHRTQWAGLDGAPTTNAFSVNTPIADSKVGLGVSFVNDKLGVITENTVSVDFSYTLDLGGRTNKNKLSFGLKGSANMLDVAYSRLLIYNLNDPQFQHDISGQFTPNIGAGIYWHNEKSYVGLSVPNFLETTRYNDNIQSTMTQRMHFFLMGRHTFALSPTRKFNPVRRLTTVEGALLTPDLTARFRPCHTLILGAASRGAGAWRAST